MWFSEMFQQLEHTHVFYGIQIIIHFLFNCLCCVLLFYFPLIGFKLQTHYSSRLWGSSEALVHDHCRRLLVFGSIAVACNLLPTFHQVASYWHSPSEATRHYRCWHSERSAITPVISNTAPSRMIRHGDASWMKPVIHHHVQRLER